MTVEQLCSKEKGVTSLSLSASMRHNEVYVMKFQCGKHLLGGGSMLTKSEVNDQNPHPS